ncbi:MAG: AAA family ATPase [Merismopedia sp. SIO2A8]|nr:AAA family ATPase [Merismopedia sp. SIO2A8]
MLQHQATLHHQKEGVQAQRQVIEDALSKFTDITTQIGQQQQEKQRHSSGYSMYLQHQQVAAQMDRVEAAFAESLAHITQLQSRYTTAQQDHQQALEGYEPEAWQRVEQEYNTIRSQGDQLRGSLPQQQHLLADIKARLTQLEDVADKRDRAQTSLAQHQQYREFITFSRSAYKEAGPRITERYVQAISHEADRLFRELLNRQNVALEWTRDYEIVVQEGAHPRRFINLSGGEQMCAALAVRLALLRVLADIDIAFFDEPTTNMDRARRERLAEAIANLRTFHQLFVISHDDTFEQFTEHVVLVQRES